LEPNRVSDATKQFLHKLHRRPLKEARVLVAYRVQRIPRAVRVLVMAFLLTLFAWAAALPALAANISNTRGDAGGTLELAGSSWLNGQGVNVYSNGNSAGNVWGNSYTNNSSGQSVFLGSKWQCVELINRLYVTRGWISGTWFGNGGGAQSIYNSAPPNLSKQPNGSITFLRPGDVVALDNGGDGHAAIVNSVSGSTAQLVNQNTGAVYSSAQFSGGRLTMSGWTGYSVRGVIHAPTSSSGEGGALPGSSNLSLHGIIGPDNAIYAKTTVGSGGWVQEVGPGNASKLAMAGNYQMFLRGDGAVFAKNTFGTNGWTQETASNAVTRIAVSATGLQLILGTDAAVYSTHSIGGGWTQEVGPGNADAIAVGGETEMFLRGDRTMFAKDGQGGAWTQETSPNSAVAIAVSSTGIHLIISTDNAIYSRQDVGWGNWIQEVGPGNAGAIALGGNTMMFLRGDSAVFAKNGRSGVWTQETSSNSATAIAIGSNGLHLILGPDGTLYSKTTIGFGGWTAETAPSAAVIIAAS
jgi:hypothetical protein